jgi:hypothetical protein
VSSIVVEVSSAVSDALIDDLKKQTGLGFFDFRARIAFSSRAAKGQPKYPISSTISAARALRSRMSAGAKPRWKTSIPLS